MDQVDEILRNFHIVAVVGMSSEPERPSFRVGSYLKDQGYKIIPVNPSVKSILGEICYPSLTSIPSKVEIVDVFRQGEALLPIAEEAIAVGARVLWMQEGVMNETAAARAREAGLLVVMDKCIRKEHLKLRYKYSDDKEGDSGQDN